MERKCGSAGRSRFICPGPFSPKYQSRRSFRGDGGFFIGVEPASRSGPGSVKGERETKFRIQSLELRIENQKFKWFVWKEEQEYGFEKIDEI